tara:strand:+ start:377 stop:847 length:471 start_codon:yes stop_codon:yes gene_type:complete
MAGNYDSKDLTWTWDGDFVLDDSGDLAHNEDDALESIETEIVTIVKSSTKDWAHHPRIGANLWRFVGEPNTRKNAEKIKDAISVALVSAGLVRKQDIKVDVNTVSLDVLYVKVFLSATSTPSNRISSQADPDFKSQYGQGIEIKFLFDTNTSAVYY